MHTRCNASTNLTLKKKFFLSEGQRRDTAIWVRGEAVYGHVWMRETGVDTSHKGRYLPYVDGSHLSKRRASWRKLKLTEHPNK